MIPSHQGPRSSQDARIPCNSRWVLYSSGFCTIHTIFHTINTFIVQFSAKEFSVIRTSTTFSKFVKGCRVPNWSISVSRYSYL